MRIQTYLNCTKQEIESKKFNIFIGISLGNKYFSKDNIEKYIAWALENTKDDVAVLIADSNHAINYKVFNNYSPERALRVAIKKGIEIENIIKEIIQNLPNNKKHLVKIAKWDSVKKSEYYKYATPIIKDEFKNNAIFHDLIINIIKENLQKRASDLSEEKLDKLATYVLDELPILINGFEFDDKLYDLHPYPGLSLLDDLWMGLRKGNLFPKLAEKIDIKNKVGQIEAYVD